MATYNLPSKIVEGPSFVMSLKLEKYGAINPKNEANPGPGAHYPDFSKSYKKEGNFTMKWRHAEPKKMHVPDPGAYTRTKDSVFMPSSKKIIFGRAPQREARRET